MSNSGNTSNTKTYHFSVHIEGILDLYEGRSMKGMLIKDDGIKATDKEVREYLQECRDKGYTLIPMDGCEGFDPFGGGCPGHEVKE